MNGPRRALVAAAMAIGLVGSLGATECTANSPSSGSGGKRATGSVVRCVGDRSCDVILRRATTRRNANRLRGESTPRVVATATAEAACLLLTRSLATHVVCAVGTSYLTSKLIHALKRAAAAGGCLDIHIQAPSRNATWRPVSYRTNSGRYCAD
jgi:hypothetical protein